LQSKKQCLADEVRQVFEFHKRRYGSRRIREELVDEGWQVGRYQVTQRMKEQGLVAIQPKRFVPKTTKTHPHLRRSPNLLLETENQPITPNEVIVGDITYLPNQSISKSGGAGNKWLFLAVWLDLFSRRIVGWQVDEHMEGQSCLQIRHSMDWKMPITNVLTTLRDTTTRFANIPLSDTVAQFNLKKGFGGNVVNKRDIFFQKSPFIL